MAADKLLTATSDAYVEQNGTAWVVERGVTQVVSGHSLAKARPDLFRPVRKGASRLKRKGSRITVPSEYADD